MLLLWARVMEESANKSQFKLTKQKHYSMCPEGGTRGSAERLDVGYQQD